MSEEVVCQFCKKTLKKQSIDQHQKKTRSCLEIQRKNKKEEKEEKEETKEIEEKEEEEEKKIGITLVKQLLKEREDHIDYLNAKIERYQEVVGYLKDRLEKYEEVILKYMKKEQEQEENGNIVDITSPEFYNRITNAVNQAIADYRQQVIQAKNKQDKDVILS